jgi:hypothetical protein
MKQKNQGQTNAQKTTNLENIKQVTTEKKYLALAWKDEKKGKVVPVLN